MNLVYFYLFNMNIIVYFKYGCDVIFKNVVK